jgi:hypothetical protein
MNPGRMGRERCVARPHRRGSGKRLGNVDKHRGDCATPRAAGPCRRCASGWCGGCDLTSVIGWKADSPLFGSDETIQPLMVLNE